MGGESHTADHRLGLVVGPENPGFQAPVLSQNQSQSPLETGQDVLDRNTTLSRSFRSSLFQSQSSPLDRLEEVGVEGNSKLKLSQVRVLTSPPASQTDILLSSASRTPANARVNSKRKTLMSNLSRKSLKSILGSGRTALRKSVSRQKTSPPATSETNLETETSLDEEVFLGSEAERCGEGREVSRPEDRVMRRGSSASSVWRDPRGRRVGSPGRTGKAEYFKRRDPLPLLPIELEDRPRTEFVSRHRVTDRRSVASAPHCAGGARPKSQHLRPPSVRRRERTQKYTEYSESDVTDFTSDEEARKQLASRRLELPARGLGTSPLSDISVTPPPPASTDVSPEQSILQQYSLVTVSDLELVNSPVPR